MPWWLKMVGPDVVFYHAFVASNDALPSPFLSVASQIALSASGSDGLEPGFFCEYKRVHTAPTSGVCVEVSENFQSLVAPC